MKITIVTGPFQPLPPAGCGAVERIWMAVAHQFCSMGHKVTFLSRGHATGIGNETVDGIDIIRRTRFKSKGHIGWDLVQDMVYTLRMLPLLPVADILVTNTFWFPILAPHMKPDAGKVVVNVARVPKGQMRFYRHVDCLAAVSKAIYNMIVDECPDVADITRVIPNPILTETFIPPDTPRNYSGQKIILYTGRIHPEKGLHLLIDAFRLLPDKEKTLKLRMVGPWRTEQGGGGQVYISLLREKAKGLSVEFVDPIHDPKILAKVLQAAHIYCYPSLAEKGESFGVAPLEAMGTGLSPVLSNLSVFLDFFEHNRTGYTFDHRKNDAVFHLAGALAKILDDPEKTAQMGECAAQRAKEFSTENVARMYLNNFEEILNRDSRQEKAAKQL